MATTNSPTPPVLKEPKSKQKEVVSYPLPPNPWEDLPRGSRLNVEIPPKKHLKLKAILPRHGSIQQIVSLYVESILIEFESAGIRHVDPDNPTTEAAIQRIILRYTHPQLAGKKSEPDDARGEAGLREPHEDAKDKPTDAEVNFGTGKQVGGEAVKGKKLTRKN